MEPYSDLISILQARTHSLIADTNVFIWMRAENGRLLQDPQFGGGNFLMALGLFSVVNFLGKVYLLLSDKGVGITEDEVREAKAWVRPRSNRAIEIKRVGQINEVTAATSLLSDCPYLCPRLKKGEIKQIWNGVRNGLSHMAVPADGITIIVRGGGGKFKDAIKDSNIRPLLQIRTDGRIMFDADSFAINIQKTVEWLSNKIHIGEYPEDSVINVLEWLKS